MNPVETKSIFVSKYFYLGLAQIGFGILGMILGKLDSTTAFAAISAGIATITLRFKTEVPVSLAGGIKYRD